MEALEAMDISIEKAQRSRVSELDFDNIPFGKIFSDHMFTADFADGEWSNLKIEPYGPLTMSPAMSAIHYGQSIFEGMKAFRNKDGNINVFRAYDNAERFNESAERMCMPKISKRKFVEALEVLLRLDKEWIPTKEGSSLYIRPFMFATDDYIGIRPSDTYKFIMFTCPVGKYYSKPVNVKIETRYTRAAAGGIGAAKAAGNYAASLYPAKLGQEKGYDQLIWTDAKDHKYIEESGTMNVLFLINDTLITPPSSETILSGITRRSIVQLAKDKGINVEERPIEVTEVINALKDGSMKAMFGAGTAATIAHIAKVGHEGTDYFLPETVPGDVASTLAKELIDIKRGEAEDTHGWNHIIEM